MGLGDFWKAAQARIPLLAAFSRAEEIQPARNAAQGQFAVALYRNDYAGVKVAIGMGADPIGARESHSGFFETPSYLMQAAEHGYNNAMRALLEDERVCATINHQFAKRGRLIFVGDQQLPPSFGSAAHKAARSANPEGLEQLSAAGASLDLMRYTVGCAFTPRDEIETQGRRYGWSSQREETLLVLTRRGCHRADDLLGKNDPRAPRP